MRKNILATAILAALPLIGTAHADDASPIVANVGIVSDYAYRGISQTDEKPALQGGLDYAHESGLYIGLWGSNVSWISDLERGTSENSGNSLELDVYAGYKQTFGDFGIDVGVLQYVYPGNYNSAWRSATGLKTPNTFEGYLGFSWQFLSFKYSHAFTNLFGAPDSKGSQYFDLTAAYPVTEDLTLTGHYGHQAITGPAKSYSDWKVGATYAYKGFAFGLHYVNTNMKDKSDYDADARYILSVTKSF
ncbi:TorF family putative porin [Azoarcus olearius]|uniref:Conserved hypothetical secreted protein n=1 Tax=Azoarcus sp. (strain BH72) TaxID=418699 RepID=A1KBZ8_AZOSB|nr:TorF family putative porin [Azoarcus olearius]CAL96354.1 conserved hypothetical secreted protein [Azoarcus olearius]